MAAADATTIPTHGPTSSRAATSAAARSSAPRMLSAHASTTTRSSRRKCSPRFTTAWASTSTRPSCPAPANPTDDHVIGDEPFDLISDCFGKIARLYKRDWKRKPTLKELIGTVQAVLEAQLQDHTRDGQSAELAGLSFKVRKIPKRQK